MNAKEAIKIVEYDLEGSKMNTETLEEIFETKLVDSRRSEEALSIVLESAKLLHKLSDVTPIYGGEAKLFSFEIEDYYLDEKTAKSIGIDYETLDDEGTDE